MKKIFKLCIVALIAITCIIPMGSVDAAISPIKVKPVHTISRNDGGGGRWGTHTKPNYKEGTTQYYRDGDIIELEFRLPDDGSETHVISDMVKFDTSKVTLLSNFQEIGGTLGAPFVAKDWYSFASRWLGRQNEIHLSALTNDYTLDNQSVKNGGVYAKVYFKVNDGIESAAGTPITFEFTGFNSMMYDKDIAKKVYNHEGSENVGSPEYLDADQTIYAKKPSINFVAENGFITQSEAKSINVANDLKTFNNVVATISDGSAATVTASSTSLATIKTGAKGTYDVSYKSSYDGVAHTRDVKITVVGETSIISPDGKNSLEASSVFITQSNAKALTSVNDLTTLNKALVTTSDGTTATPTITAPNYASIKAGVVGAYDVTYSYGTGTSAVAKTTKVTVVKDGSVIAPDNSASLFAQNGNIRASEARALANTNALIPYNGAAVTLIDGTIVAPTVTVTSSDWLSLHAGTKGFYNVLYSYGTGVNEIRKTVNINVIDDNGEVSEDGKSTLSASNVELTQTEAKAVVNTDTLLTLNKVSATHDNGTTVANVKPTVSAPGLASIKLGTIGTYAVTYSYGTGTSAVAKTVNVSVVKDPKHVITAKNAIIKESPAKALSSKEELRAVNSVIVNAIDGSKPNAVVEAPDWASIKAGKNGIYTVTYSYGTGDKLVSESVLVIVVPDDSTGDEEANVYAKSGFLTQTEAKNLTTKESLIAVNEAVVTLVTGGTALPVVNMSTANWNAVKAGTLGVYDVGYSFQTTNNNLTKNVKVTVIKDGSEESEDGTVSLFAENGFIKSNEAKALANKEQLRAINNATVTLDDGSAKNAEVTVAPADWLAIKQGSVGSYDILYTYGTGSKAVLKTVKMNVIADDSVISPNGKVALSASNVEISTKEAKDLANQKALMTFNKAVVTLDDGTTVDPVMNISTNDWNAIKAGTENTYSVTYTYGTGQNAVSKTVTVKVVKRTEDRLVFDYDKNGRIDIADFADFIRFYTYGGANASAIEFMLSDYNGDGRINIDDLSEIRYYMTNPDKKPPIIQVPIN